MPQTIKNLPALQETRVRSWGREDPLEKGMATHSSILAWRIPQTEEPGGLQFMGSQRVRHDWVTKHTHRYTFWIYFGVWSKTKMKFIFFFIKKWLSSYLVPFPGKTYFPRQGIAFPPFLYFFEIHFGGGGGYNFMFLFTWKRNVKHVSSFYFV